MTEITTIIIILLILIVLCLSILVLKDSKCSAPEPFFKQVQHDASREQVEASTGTYGEVHSKNEIDEAVEVWETNKQAETSSKNADITSSKEELNPSCNKRFELERAIDIFAQTPSSSDYYSAAPKRDRYYQPLQGYMGETILSGFPYFANRSL